MARSEMSLFGVGLTLTELGIFGFWILDFGFWIGEVEGALVMRRRAQSKIQNLKSKISLLRW
ncbi:MAG TPA: hypothetical protein VFB82_22800, partial [Blastocatellia bacterium]|nr:hypothetical protein [Blastocatellia bacterium]